MAIVPNSTIMNDGGDYHKQTTITSATTAANRTIKTNPNKSLNIQLILESGSPTTGAKVQYTLDTHSAVNAGTATFIDSPTGYTTASRGESAINMPCGITGVIASVSDGTWSLIVRQQ